MKKMVKIAEIWAESTKSRDDIIETLENAGFVTSYVEDYDTQIIVMKMIEIQ